MIAGIAHVNLTVPSDAHAAVDAFYAQTLGLAPRPVPALQKSTLAWFDIAASGQQVHIAFNSTQTNEALASRHPCFKVAGPEDLAALQTRIWDKFRTGDHGAPVECDEPGKEGSGATGVEYPTRFFCRDFANNRLEFSL